MSRLLSIHLGGAAAALALAAPAPVLAAPVVAACSLTIPAKTKLVEVPFTTVDGRIYVTAQVNGRGSFRFAVDTGASGIGRADATLTRELALPAANAGQTSDGVSTATVDQVRISTLALGGLVRRDSTVITRDYRSRLRPEAMFAGILGREFFGDGLLVIDYPRSILAFTRGASLRPGMAGTVSYERAFRVPVSIGRGRTTGNIDTGANVSYVMPKTLYSEVSAEPLQPGPDGRLMNGSVRSERGQVTAPIVIGTARLAASEVRVSQDYPELLIGAHALQDHRILIDQRSRLVALCPAH